MLVSCHSTRGRISKFIWSTREGFGVYEFICSNRVGDLKTFSYKLHFLQFLASTRGEGEVGLKVYLVD